MTEAAAKKDTPKDEAGEKLGGALKLIVESICMVLQTDKPSRFADAVRLCNIGQSLVKTSAKRVQDFAVLEVDEDAQEDAGGLRYQQRGLNGGGYVDQNEVTRNFMLTFGPNAQIQAEAQRASVAAQEAHELQCLLAARTEVSAEEQVAINGRIRQLMDNMEARNNAKPEVVPSDVSRRHPTGEGEPERDSAPRLRADPLGGGGDGGVARACRQEDVDEGAVGHG